MMQLWRDLEIGMLDLRSKWDVQFSKWDTAI